MSPVDLRTLKTTLGLTVVQLAQRLGLSKRQAARLLSGENNISGAVLVLARQLEREAKR